MLCKCLSVARELLHEHAHKPAADKLLFCSAFGKHAHLAVWSTE